MIERAQVTAHESGLRGTRSSIHLERPGACRGAPCADCLPDPMSKPCKAGPPATKIIAAHVIGRRKTESLECRGAPANALVIS